MFKLTLIYGDFMNFGTEKISTLFKKIFIPTLLGMISMSAITAIDGMFVGHSVGSDGIAAINITAPLFMVFTGIGLMSGIGSSVIASMALAKGKIKLARLNVSQSLLFLSIFAVILSALIFIFPVKTAYLLGSSEYLLNYVKTYLLWIVPSFLFLMWSLLGLFMIRLDGAPKLAMWITIIESIANTFFDWLFMFPFGWGLMGAAFASTLATVIGGVLILGYLLCKAKTLRLYPIKIGLRGFSLFARGIFNQCRIGSSAMLGEATMAVLMFVGNHIFMQYLGDNGVGAFGVCCYYAPFVFMIGNAVAQSAQPIISYNFGLCSFERMKEAVKIALSTALGFGIATTFIFSLFPHFMVGLFLQNENSAAKLAVQGFPYFAIGFSFFILNLTIIGYFQSLERIKPATFFAVLRGGVFLIPAFIFLPKILGIKGIWLAMPLSEILTFAAIGVFYLLQNNSCTKKTALRL